MLLYRTTWRIAQDEALYGQPKEFRWVLVWQKVNVQCHYWSGPFNENRITIRISKSGKGDSEVLGAGWCRDYVDGEVIWSDSGRTFSNLYSAIDEQLSLFAEYRNDDDGSGPFARLKLGFQLFVIASLLTKLTTKVG